MRTALSIIFGLTLAACGNAQVSLASQGTDEPAAAAELASYSGEVAEAGGTVSFDIELQAGALITLETSSVDRMDTTLTLNAPNGRQLAANDDADGTTLLSRIVFQTPETGTYRAVVGGYADATGNFELHVQEGMDAGLSAQASLLSEEIVSLSAQTRNTDHPVTLAEGDILVATTVALTADLDTTLALLGTGGTVLAQNDDRGDGTLNSQIVYQASEDGDFIIRTGSFNDAGQGDLALSIALDPNAEVPFDYTTVVGEVIATHRGEIQMDGRSQTYPITLEAGETIFAMIDTTFGDLDPVLTLRDADGYPVAYNDDRADGTLNSAFAYTAEEAGTYTFVVDRYQSGNSTGAFELSVSRVDASVVEMLQELLERIITLSGEPRTLQTEDFVVHYTLDGDDATTEAYAIAVGEALQHSFEEQIVRMGWAEPVRDEAGLYHAYIADAEGSMGVAYPVETVFDNPNTNIREPLASRAIFLIENDFAGFDHKEAPPISLMRATATHEFAHIVQYGYDSQEGLDWLYEATSSWIETVTVGADQDATDYTETDYESPHLCWTTSESGFNYSQWTLLASLAEQYGERVVVDIWENTVELDGFATVETSLNDVGTTIPEALQRWRAQNFARDYDLAPVFPRAVRLHHTLRAPGRWVSKGGPQELGANYIALEMSGRHRFDLDTDGDLELIALGQRDGQIDVIPLGQSGVVDLDAYDYAALMVFNRALPAMPGQCSSQSYTITSAPTINGPGQAVYNFSAEHFQPLTEEVAETQ